MNKKTVGFAAAILCGCAIIAGIFYWIGYRAADGRTEDSGPALIPQTFYATISDIQGDMLTVKGMEINDINFRGEFCFSVAEETEITWRYADIPLTDLEVGDSVSITFTGEILETYPAQIRQVAAIRLLDDEK